METRSRTQAHDTRDIGAMDHIAQNSAPSLTHGSTRSTEPQASMGWQFDESGLSGADLTDPIEFMRQLEDIGWNGGDNYFAGNYPSCPVEPTLRLTMAGIHNEFCFVCGGAMNLVGCQTCETCYHASCMSPTLGPDDVPTFWFCPHCVDRQLHVPLDAATASNTFPQSAETSSSSGTSVLGQTATLISPKKPSEPDPRQSSECQMISIAASKQKITTITRDLPPSSVESRKEANFASTKKPPGRPRTTRSPPRKKSKYSAFSSEVDKALAVIHRELESAAQVGRAENSLGERIQILEQELRLKDGQILLVSQELKVARRNGDTVGLKAEINQLREQNESLKSLVESKDHELRDWRTKLKGLLGDDAA